MCYCSNFKGLHLEYKIEGRVVKYEYMIILFVFLTDNIVYAFLIPIKIR